MLGGEHKKNHRPEYEIRWNKMEYHNGYHAKLTWQSTKTFVMNITFETVRKHLRAIFGNKNNRLLTLVILSVCFFCMYNFKMLRIGCANLRLLLEITSKFTAPEKSCSVANRMSHTAVKQCEQDTYSADY